MSQDPNQAFLRHHVPIESNQPPMSHEVIQSTILSLWQAIDDLSRIKSPRPDRYSVTIFGSARIPKESPFYKDAKRLASELTDLGCNIVTGGGPGLMEAANEGSVLADSDNQTKSIGISIALDHEQEVNPFVKEVFQHQNFFSRLHHFVLVSDAFVVMPGGIGTTLEAMMVWQLLQVRSINQTPLIMVGEMWSELVEWAEKSMVPGMADAANVRIPVCVASVDEAIALLQKEHQQWQSRCD